MNRLLKRKLLLIALLIGIASTAFAIPKVAANHGFNPSTNNCNPAVSGLHGRPICHGYYTNIPVFYPASEHYAPVGGLSGIKVHGDYSAVNSATSFINRIRSDLNLSIAGCEGNMSPTPNPSLDQGSWSTCINNKVRVLSSSFYINIMLGTNQADFSGSTLAGINYARANVDRWESVVRQYDANGWVRWSGVECTGGIYSSNTLTSVTLRYGTDAGFMINDGQVCEDSIVFFDRPPSQSGARRLFQMVKMCGNIHRYAEPLVVASGRVYATNDAGVTRVSPGVPVRIDLCHGRTVNTDNNGNWFASFSQHGTFCARVINSSGITEGPGAVPSGWVGPPQTNNRPEYASRSTYEFQVALGHCYHNDANCGDGNAATRAGADCNRYGPGSIGGSDYVLCWDRNPDTGYDFVYTIPPPVPPTVSCSASPNSIDVGASTTITISGTATGSITWGGDRGSASPGNVASFSTTYSSPGSKTIIVNRGGAPTGSCTVVVSYRPYLRVFGGDVQAGSGFGEGCTATNAGAKILTYNKGSSDGYAGSGSSMAVFALGVINGFSSANGSRDSVSGKFNFTFSNDTAAPLNEYGGSYGVTYCAYDYWQDAPDLPPTSLTINGRNLDDPGDSEDVYVDGNVTIMDNIVYSDSGAWASLSEIPSFRLIVRGNIYIHNAVSQLDGVYIAIPNGPSTGGKIYTCTNGSSPYTGAPVSIPAADCNRKLTINGAFLAKEVRFLRTSGTVGNAASNETSATSQAAEVFIYGPELWVR